MLRITGEVVAVDVREYNFTPEGETQARSGVTRTVKVQTSRSTIVDVKVPTNMPIPEDGASIDVQVTAAARNGRVVLTVAGDYRAVTRNGELVGKSA